MHEQRRGLLISKGWVQAVILVVLFGFFVLGLLAYRTYQAKPPIPERVVAPSGAVLYTERDVERGQEVFLNNGLMEYGSVFGHGAYLGPDYTADYLRRAADQVRAQLRRRALGQCGTADDRRLQDQPLRRADRRAGADRGAGGGPPPAGPPLLALLLGAHDEAWPPPGRHHRPRRPRRAHRLLRLDRVGGRGRAARPRLLVHEQLAAGAARRQRAHGERDRLVRPVADRAPWRHRTAVRGVRPVEHPRLARPRAGHPELPRLPVTWR